MSQTAKTVAAAVAAGLFFLIVIGGVMGLLLGIGAAIVTTAFILDKQEKVR